MALVESQKFYKDLESGIVAPLYLISGDEPFLLEQAYSFLKGTLLEPHDIDFNFQVFHGAELDIESLIDSLQVLPMMSARRVVILKEAEEMKDSQWEALAPFFLKPIDSTVFAIFASRVDKRKKIFKVLVETGTVLEFKKPFENQIPSWIRYIAKNLALEIDDEAIHETHRRVGSHLLEIESALKSLRDFIGEKRRLTQTDVESFLSQTREESIFDLVASLGHGDRVKSLELLVNVLDQGQNEVGLISLLARHFRILFQLKRNQTQGLHGARLAQALQIPPYFLNQYLEQGRVWSENQLMQILVILSTTDRALKSSPLAGHLWLESLILQVTSLKRQQPLKQSYESRHLGSGHLPS